jgi:2-polyprenyl-3-methyl-5-hydroxy-6-metoxy-1,4-benzoquinol methylase
MKHLPDSYNNMKDKLINKGFGNKYAELYDTFYSDKDYNKETYLLEKIFKRYNCSPGKKILDIGCGTGNHAIRMAKKGYKITGVDSSESMLEVAKRKCLKESIRIKLKKRCLPELNLNEKYDGIECMFNVIDYVLEDKNILKSLINIKEVLDEKGVFVFDFRNAIPSINEYDSKRVIHSKYGKKDLFRVSYSTVDPKTRTFDTEYECFIIEGGTLIERFKDMHKVRFFYPEEMKEFINKSGLSLEEMFPFGKPKKNITDKDWNIIAVCKK